MARLGYTNEDFLNLLLIHGECNRITARTCRVFTERYPNKEPPNHNTVKRLMKNCTEFGSFKEKPNKNKPLVDNEVVEVNVLAYFSAYPEASISQAITNLRYSYGTIHRILKKHKWKPFSFTLVHHLKEGDLVRRMNFCEWFLVKTQEDNNFLKDIIWVDEAKFAKNGMFNRHNSHYWAPENPHRVRERGFQESWKFNVFCAVKGNKMR